MNLHDYIQKKRALLIEHINNIFEDKKKLVPTGLQTYTDTLNHLQTIVPNGKLLRGIQILLSYEMFSSTPTTEIMNAAAALEIMQASVLIQDDFMDNDYTRRGARSVFAQYADIGKEKHATNPLLYGQSMAVCVGDIGYFLAFEFLNKSSTDTNKNQRINDLFSREWQLLGAGQMMDVDISSYDYDPTEEDIMTIYTYKTARYSFSLPLMIGAILSDADENIIQKLDSFGQTLGIIFQIKDDELGLYGDEQTIGKPVGSDIRENKKTLYRSLLMKKSTEEEKVTIKKIFGNKNITDKEIQLVKSIIHSHGIDDDIQKRVETMSKEADSIVDSIQTDEKYKSLLKEFIELNLKRVK